MWQSTASYEHLSSQIYMCGTMWYRLSRVKPPGPSKATDPGVDSCFLCGDFPGSNHTSELNIGAPVATLPGAWCYRVSAETGWLGISRLWLGEIESLIYNFCLSVAEHTTVWADPFLRYTSMLLRGKATNKPTHLQDSMMKEGGQWFLFCLLPNVPATC